MGPAVSTIETVVDVVADNKRWYNCPKCGARVWAYGAFEGNTCLDCPGTFIDATVLTVKVATSVVDPLVSAVETLGDVVTHTKRWYNCPGCGARVWAYGAFKGNTCLKCPGTLLDATLRVADHATTGGVIRSRDGGLVGAIANTIATAGDGVSERIGVEPAADDSQKVLKIRCRSIWLGHGGWAAPASVITGAVVQSPVTHWWVEIEAEAYWYCAQFDGGKDLVLTRHGSQEDVTAQGKSPACKRSTFKAIDDRYTYDSRHKSVTIGDVRRFMRSYPKDYHLTKNNCQTFAKGLYDWI